MTPAPLPVLSFLIGVSKPSMSGELESIISSKCVSENHKIWYDQYSNNLKIIKTTTFQFNVNR